MGQILHQRATTTQRQREEIQHSTESIARLAERYGINPKTVIKWRNRQTVEDAPMGPKKLRTVLCERDEAIILAFRKKTQLGLDDCLFALQDSIPALTRSNLHRCLKRHGVSVLEPLEPLSKKSTKKFKKYPIGYIHMDICEVRTGGGKAYLYCAIDRTCKFAYVEVHRSPTIAVAVSFLKNFMQAIPYKVTRILTDNGPQFTYELLLPHCRPKNKTHPFDVVCQANGIEHRLTKFRHPWTNGQVERMNRTLKDATVKTYFYETIDDLKRHVHDFLMAYNFAKKLRALRGLTPYEMIIESWKKDPSGFHHNPIHYLVGRNT